MQRSFQEAGADEFKPQHPIIITPAAQSRVEAGEGGGERWHNYLNFVQGTRRRPGILKGDWFCSELPPCHWSLVPGPPLPLPRLLVEEAESATISLTPQLSLVPTRDTALC